MASDSTKDDDSKKGVHDAQAREVRLDDYPERSYRQAMTKEQRAALEEAGLLE